MVRFAPTPDFDILGEIFMNTDKRWMLMTYYCPVHGDSSRVEPLQIKKDELSNKFLQKSKSRKIK